MKHLLTALLISAATICTAQDRLVFVTGDTVRCEISGVSSAHVHFINEAGDPRKVTVSYLKNVYYDGKWRDPTAFRNTYMTTEETEEGSMMYAQPYPSELVYPGEFLEASGNLFIAGTITPILAGVIGLIIGDEPGAFVAGAGVLAGFICILVAGIRLRDAGKIMTRYDTKYGISHRGARKTD